MHVLSEGSPELHPEPRPELDEGLVEGPGRRVEGLASNPRMILANQDTQQMLRDALETSRNRRAVALMLKLAGAQPAHVHYMKGSIILMKHEDESLSPWQRLSPWLVEAIERDRLDLILTEIEAGAVGLEATPPEVFAYLHPVTPYAPWWPPADDWIRLYLWVRHHVLSRYQGQLSWELVDAEGEPVPLSGIVLTGSEQQTYRDLARQLRQRVIETAARREPAIPAVYRRHQVRPIFFDIGESFEALFRGFWPDQEVPHAHSGPPKG